VENLRRSSACAQHPPCRSGEELTRVAPGLQQALCEPGVCRSPAGAPHVRGLHSSTFQLNVSAFCGTRRV